MVDINKIFDLHNRIDKIERRKQLFDQLDKSRFSAFDQQRDALTQIMLKSNRDLQVQCGIYKITCEIYTILQNIFVII